MIRWQEAHRYFHEQYGSEPQICCSAPGRVNLIGEHIDYAGGQVLPISISLGVTVCASLGGDALRVASGMFPEAGIANASEAVGQGPLAYVRTLAEQTGVTDADIAVCSDLPLGRGLSSSAAVGIAIQAALFALSEDEVLPSARAVCRAAQRAEQAALGTNCGLMDQYASMFGSATDALLIDIHAQTHEYIPLDGLLGCSLLLVDSGQPRLLHASGYNERPEEMRQALEQASELAGGFDCFREVEHDELLRIASGLPEPLDRRLRHVASEQRRVLQFRDALLAADRRRMGELLMESHASLRDDCEVSTPEIDSLVETIGSVESCLGARIVGGGFGGGVLALFEGTVDDAVLSEALASYHAETGMQASAMQLEPGLGAWLEVPGGVRYVAEWLS